jgi:hypothetical protein
MFEQLIDGVRKASESSLQMQQELFRHWTRVLTSSTSASTPGIPSDLGRAQQRRWLELGIEMLHKHREALDATYRSGIQIIEQSLQLQDAKSTEDVRRTVEDLWRKLYDLQKGQTESQFRDLQGWYEKSASIAQEARS